MKPAPGGPEMTKALSNQYVLGIVTILLQILDQEFFRDVALFLSQYNQRTQRYFAETLSEFRARYEDFPDEEGLLAVPDYIEKLIDMLEALYQHDDRTVGFLRGAIVEQLIYQMVLQRYSSDECFSNYRFLDSHNRNVTGQIDVAVLSHKDLVAEGYECKIKVSGIASEDCDNLKALVKVAHNEEYAVHVGIVSFENDRSVKAKLEYLAAPSYIETYGLDSIQYLRDEPQYIEPDEYIENE
ncbi:MAG TPA: hypothetical protein VKU38_06050 [Ktedonobacteraceae bacterium]|nr:hypothetical protein [Ktedonobacteraceae bacterium]